MGKQRNIYVAGDYIASQTFGTYIAHAEHVHTQASGHRLVEDIDFEQVPTSAPSDKASELYPFVVSAKLAELKLYSMSEFETMYRTAADKDAPDLAQFLKQYNQLQVLDFGRRNKKQIFEILQAFFPDEIHYSYNNFITYF